MNKTTTGKNHSFEAGPEPIFWESELYSKSYFKNLKNKSFLYYDSCNVLKFLFYHWLNRWVFFTSKTYLEPYKCHPLPASDQLLRWQPIFSKHVSDGLLRLELYEAAKTKPGAHKAKKPYKSILCRAIFLTLGKRSFFCFSALIIINVLSMSVSFLVKCLLEILNDKLLSFIKTLLLLLAIIGCQILNEVILKTCTLYISRLNVIVHYLISCCLFQKGFCYRRKYFNSINGSNSLNVCNQVLHSCSPDSECSKNPLFCQALRYQNKGIDPQIFNIETCDIFYISMAFEALITIVEFVTNLIYGVFLLSLQVKSNLWALYVFVSLILFLMIVSEILSAYTFKFVMQIRDQKATKLNHILFYLSPIKNVLFDDIAINIIAKSRNFELSIFFIHMFLTFFNITLYTTCMNVSFYVIKLYFVKSVNNANVITDIDTAGFITTFYVLIRIITSMFLIPVSIKFIGMTYISIKRIDIYISSCSPNFYISDNKYTGSTKTSLEITDTTNQIPNDVIVYYKNASFTWVNTRSDLLNKNYEPYLKNINFELKRGEMAIVTGSQGSGKSNFIKSMLCEMTLVGGSMAVVPLHTSMPIFYASQDIFLQQGTIRSNIVFGYKFDEHLYNSVLKAVELEYDISTWEKVDMRVVSDNAHTLSGGQRVRMELARALYAYLVFHKVNAEYNNGKCSFLMCLDASFHGLDPYVSKTVFNNLFNIKTGVLMKDDLSVVLTSSKQYLDICSKTSDFSKYPDCPIYKMKNQTLLFYSYLHNFIKHNKVDNPNYTYLKSTNTGPYQMSYLTKDVMSLCLYDSTRLGRIGIAKSDYDKSFNKFVNDEFGDVKIDPHKAYFSPAICTFTIFMLISIGYNVLDNVKYIFSTNLSDYITKNINYYKNGQFVDLSEIKSRSNFSLRITTIFVSLVVVLSFLSTIFISISCITSSRKIHEYCINSIFKYSSSILKIKNDISQIMTYIVFDISIVDDSNVLYLSLFLFSLVQTFITILTLFYLVPISIPLVIITLIFLFKYILINFIESSKNVHLAYLECSANTNYVHETAISGSSTYRSLKREFELVDFINQHKDYRARCVFLYKAILTWIYVVCNWILAVPTLLTTFTILILDKFTKFKSKPGHFGLTLSLFMNFIRSFNMFALCYSMFEIYMCSVRRFQYFVPPGTKLKFDKCLNTHEEYLVIPRKKSAREMDKKNLLKRRAIEFKNENKKFYHLRRLFFHPKINILDVRSHLSPFHVGVNLRDVCVYITPDYNPEGMILKHVTMSAHSSDIIGMVGRTGAGKTTLLSVLQNLVENRTGQVLLDGKDLNDIPKVVLRQIIGVLPQLPFVFKGWTVRRFLDPRRLFTDDEVNKALSQCGLLNFVNDLPGGKKLDTIIVGMKEGSFDKSFTHKKYKKERSVPIKNNESDPVIETVLSNGQLRTLSMARLVLYRNFYRMIVVDEPPEEDLMDETSAINDDLGVPIYDLLTKYFSHCTTFVTAHNVNILKTCTSVWVIHNGLLIRTCKTSDIAANESIANIIEESLKST